MATCLTLVCQNQISDRVLSCLKNLQIKIRVPRISIICLDHVGLDQNKGDGAYPGFPYRLLLRAKEISYLARVDSISKTNLVRLIYLTLVREFRFLTQKININLVITRLQLYFPFIDRPKAGELDIYRQDGSFVQILPEKESGISR